MEVSNSYSENDKHKNMIETERENVNGVFSAMPELLKSCETFKFSAKEYDKKHEIINKDLYAKFFGEVFNEKRAKSLVNILKPRNDYVYNKENIESLKFSKGEILKGFKRESIENDGINELKVKCGFWLNKMTKLIDLKEIDLLSRKPFSMNVEENYYKAYCRLTILQLMDSRFKHLLDLEIDQKYFETYGISISDDREIIKECEKVRKSLYDCKTVIVEDFLSILYKSIKNKEKINNIQAMGITQNEKGLVDYVGSYMLIIRAKGYTSNTYFHVPSTSFAKITDRYQVDGKYNPVPESQYYMLEPDKIIPVNVICKVEKDSERYKMIKSELEMKKKSKVLKQAVAQINGGNLTVAQISKWKNERIVGLSVG